MQLHPMQCAAGEVTPVANIFGTIKNMMLTLVVPPETATSSRACPTLHERDKSAANAKHQSMQTVHRRFTLSYKGAKLTQPENKHMQTKEFRCQPWSGDLDHGRWSCHYRKRSFSFGHLQGRRARPDPGGMYVPNPGSIYVPLPNWAA
jgi:hypothetical protein